MLTTLANAALILAGLYTFVTLANLLVFRPPRLRPEGALPRVSVLIPARDEAANIGDALAHVRRADGIEIEVVVLDDGSSDGTGEIVAAAAREDPRVRLIHGGTLPAGWNGKQHACWQLAHAARNPVLVFMDADVRLERDALARMVGHLERRRLDLVSGFPQQITRSLAEKLVVPQILVLLLGYLPFPMARVFRAKGFAAGCGQLMIVRAEAYRRAGGHSAIRTTMHDGIRLPRRVRASGGRTDIVDATGLARCRMYDSWPALWTGFSKNATEGMATPLALPIWTVLLGGGHILPYLVALAAFLADDAEALTPALEALMMMLAARVAVALVARQSFLSVVGHPVGMTIVLAIQWIALWNARRGTPREWRGRSYDVS
jgi:cellulose synthase/poly-beta-1,6-N-acetylglucosamine synthase-like glycosyltransferase